MWCVCECTYSQLSKILCIVSAHVCSWQKKNRCDLEKYLWSFFCYLYMVINRFGMLLFSGVVGGEGLGAVECNSGFAVIH